MQLGVWYVALPPKKQRTSSHVLHQRARHAARPGMLLLVVLLQVDQDSGGQAGRGQPTDNQAARPIR